MKRILIIMAAAMLAPVAANAVKLCMKISSAKEACELKMLSYSDTPAADPSQNKIWATGDLGCENVGPNINKITCKLRANWLQDTYNGNIDMGAISSCQGANSIPPKACLNHFKDNFTSYTYCDSFIKSN